MYLSFSKSLNTVSRSRNSLLVRSPDSWSKDCKFKSRQEWWDNFLLQSQLCVLTLIRCPFHPRVTAVAGKRLQSFCQKCRWQVTPKHIHPWPNEVAVGWLCCCPGIVWEPIRKLAHWQLIREHLVTVVSARAATVDWSWPKELNKCVQANLHCKKKKKEKKVQAGNELSNILPKILTRKDRATTTR